MDYVRTKPIPSNNFLLRFYKEWIALIMFALLITAIPTESQACNYFRKLDRFNKAVDRYLNLVAMGAPPAQIGLAAARVCRLRRDIDQKFKNRPGKMTPPIPGGIDCSMLGGGGGGGGGGRGGVGGGGGSPGGGPIPFNVWIRNHDTTACMVSWEIVAEPGNPAGFTVNPSSGSLSVGAFATGTALVPFTIDIDAAVAVGAIAEFQVILIDSCNNLPFGEEFGFFEVVATENVQIAPIMPLVPVPDSPTPFMLGWRLTNNTSDTILKSYSFNFVPDPASEEFLNNGAPYAIRNAVPTDKSNFGGMVAIPPNDFVDIDWEMISTQYCDPEMLGCCAIEVDGAACCIMTPNEESTPTGACGDTYQLVGMPQGGNVDVVINHNLATFPIMFQSSPSDDVGQILDQIAFQMIEFFDFQPGFNFQPVVDEDEFMLMLPPGANAQFFSTDPGLQWQAVGCNDSINVGIEADFYESLPVMMNLHPNPANQEARMTFTLKQSAHVSLECQNLQGQHQGTFLPGRQYPAGEHETMIDLSELSPGIYFFTLRAGNRTIVRRLVRN